MKKNKKMPWLMIISLSHAIGSVFKKFLKKFFFKFKKKILKFSKKNFQKFKKKKMKK